jgi:hypothetical protein
LHVELSFRHAPGTADMRQLVPHKQPFSFARVFVSELIFEG